MSHLTFSGLTLVLAAATGISALCAPLPSAAQTAYPSRPVRMIVPFSAGASPDVMARIVAEDLAKDLGQPIVVENKPGAGGNVAAEYVAKQPPDGYTLFVGSTGNMAVNKTLYKNLPYDPEKDFTPLTVAWITRNILIVPAGSPFASVADVIAAARRTPGALSFGSPGTGTAGHLVGEMFQTVTKTQLTHVPYKGQNQVVTDLLGGHIQLSFETIGSAMPNIESGKVRALAITGASRHPGLPSVPTFSEVGVAEVDGLQGWAMFALPASAPSSVVTRLQRALGKALQEPVVKKRLEALGVDLSVTTSEESRRMIHDEVQRWGQLVKASGAQAN